jgi:hypothetical protein
LLVQGVPGPLLIPLNTPAVAGAVPLTIVPARRRSVSEPSPGLFPASTLAHQPVRRSTFPLGDCTLDGFFNTNDILLTLLYVSSRLVGFSDPLGNSLRVSAAHVCLEVL